MRLLFVLLLSTLLFSLPLPVSAADHETCGDTYQVARGDWLSTIARRCGVSVQELLEANPQIADPARIYTGQLIVIPGLHEPTVRIQSEQAPAGWQIAIQIMGFPPDTPVEYGIGPEGQDLTPAGKSTTDSRGRLLALAAIPESAQDGQKWVAGAVTLTKKQVAALSLPITVVSEPPTYTVRRGDRLSRIAANFKTSVAALLDLNPDIENPHRIFVGQKLVVPPEGYQATEESIQRASSMPIPPAPGGSLPKDLEPGERWIDVNLTTQTVHAYEGEELVKSFIVSTGKPKTPTVTGQYRIYVKLEKTDMRGPGYHLRGVPHTMYFYRGYGLHGTYWHSNFGTPMSAGCVNLSIEDAEWLFNFASVGTIVNVHF